MSSPCDTTRTDPNAAVTSSAIHSRSAGVTGRTFIELPSCLFDCARCLQRCDLRVVAAEQLTQHPVGILTECRPGLVVPGRRVGHAEPVAFVEPGPEERVLV